MVFLGFVALCFTVVLVIVLVRGTWESDAWVAVGSIAACVQAVAVVVALVYAALQIAEGRLGRRDELFDRLDALVYGELFLAFDAQRLKCREIRSHLERGAKATSDSERNSINEAIMDTQAELFPLERRTLQHIHAAKRLLRRLGESEGPLDDYLTQMIDYSVFEIPTWEEIPVWLGKTSDARLRGHFNKMVEYIESLVEKHTANRFG